MHIAKRVMLKILDLVDGEVVNEIMNGLQIIQDGQQYTWKDNMLQGPVGVIDPDPDKIKGASVPVEVLDSEINEPEEEDKD